MNRGVKGNRRERHGQWNYGSKGGKAMAAINRRYIDSGLDVGRVVEVAGWVLSRGKGRASITSLRGGRLEAGWPHSLKSQEGEFEGGGPCQCKYHR